MDNCPAVLRNYLFLMGYFQPFQMTLKVHELWVLFHIVLSRVYFYLIFLIVSICSFSLKKAFSEGSIGEFLYVNFMINEFSRLNITSIGRKLVQEEDDCAFACLKIPTCFSYNMATSPDDNGKLLCELLASDKYNNSDKFITSKEFHHFHIPVSETTFILN